jgi:predicted nucleic acid-binding protein
MSAVLLVADSGPLIALARLDRLDLPAHYFESVLVPSTVWEEVTHKPGADEAPRLLSAVDAKLIRVVADPATIPESLVRTIIGAGERRAIALAIELKASLLMDDRRARLIAIELGRPVIGTLGLLLRGREDELFPVLRPLLERLQASGYYLPRELVREILASLGE